MIEDPWFWVNDWYSWVSIYTIGWAISSIIFVRILGTWKIDEEGNLYFDLNCRTRHHEFGSNTNDGSAVLESMGWSLFWPFIAIFCTIIGVLSAGEFLVGKAGGHILAPKPPPELVKSASQKKTEILDKIVDES